MRRRLSNAYLIQTILVVALLALLVYLMLHGATPLVIALALLVGASLAALPSILAGGVLPARDSQRAERIRQTGVIASAAVLSDPDDVYTQFKRGLARFRSPRVLVEVPVSMQPEDGSASYTALMLAPLATLPQLKRGRVIRVRLDPSNPAYVVLDEALAASAS
jgi:hypothetical protein